jgi:hypothetical protein
MGMGSCWPRDTFYQQKLALTSPTSGGRSVGIVRSRTQSTEFVLFVKDMQYYKHFIWILRPNVRDIFVFYEVLSWRNFLSSNYT